MTLPACAVPVAVGNPAPHLALRASDGRDWCLAHHLGRNLVVLFFYARNGSPLCVQEARAFAELHPRFAAAGAVVFGIGPDRPPDNALYEQQLNLPYMLLSDPEGKARRALDVASTLGLFPDRATFVIDRRGIIRFIHRSLLSPASHAFGALRSVEALESNDVQS